MDIKTVLDTFLQQSTIELKQFVRQTRKDLKLFFINAKLDTDTRMDMRKIQSYLSALNMTIEERGSVEIQFLYTELGMFFKRCDDLGAVSNCMNKIVPSVLKSRLGAWTHYKQYTSTAAHINLLHRYLGKLSSSVTDGEENYENDVIRDLNTYYNEATKEIVKFGNMIELERFRMLFESNELANSFPIISFYRENREQFDLHANVNDIILKVFEPSSFSEKLFNEKFLHYIRGHQKTVWHNILLGFTFEHIKSQIIGYGQTDYDKKLEGLIDLDIVKLYAYCNMRMHFFAAIFLFERSDIFLTLYKSSGALKFIDIGCGPGTSALALIDHIHRITNEPVSFDYIGVDYYQTMRNGAKYFMDNDTYIPKYGMAFIEKLSEIDFELLSHANCIIINASYLFASTNLVVEELARDVLNVRNSQLECPCYFLFQNPIDSRKNLKFAKFKILIGNHETIYSGQQTIPYSNKRNSFRSTSQTVFQEILKL